MKYANNLTLEDIKEFLNSLNIDAQNLAGSLPNKSYVANHYSLSIVKFNTPKFKNLYVLVGDYEIYFSTHQTSSQWHKPWRQFVFNKLKQKDESLSEIYKNGYINFLSSKLEKLQQEIKEFNGFNEDKSK